MDAKNEELSQDRRIRSAGERRADGYVVFFYYRALVRSPANNQVGLSTALSVK